MRNHLKSFVCALAALALLSPAAIAGDENGPVSKTVSVRGNGDSPSRERVTLGLNKAAIIELPADAADVLVSNPAIVDAIVRTPRRIYILGLTVGQTNAFFFSDSGKQLLNLEINVQRDMGALDDILAKHFPKMDIRVESINDNIVLTGTVPSASIAEQARDIAVRYVGKPEQVLSMLNVAGREQVMIRVRVAEMQRVISKQLGINLTGTVVSGGVPMLLNTSNPFSLLGRSLSPDSGVAIGDAATNNVEGTLRTLERAGIVKLLAEPNLTAISGEEAKFLAGGEFPVPVAKDANGNITLEFKPFGVGLAFTPVVLSEGRISLKIATEVSEITTEGAFTLAGQTITNSDGTTSTVSGLTIPGLRVRRANSVVEMPSGGSLMIAGLLRDDLKQNIDGLPGVKDLPVLGALFRSRDFQANQTELVVIVSAVLVDPVSGRELAAPTDGYVPPNDAEAYANGQMNATYRGPSPTSQPNSSAGYIIE
jgi:pilus assembly protein CpaC